MSVLVIEIRRLRKENKKLVDDLRIANERMTMIQEKLALLILEKSALKKQFDDFKTTSDIFGGIFNGKKN